MSAGSSWFLFNNVEPRVSDIDIPARLDRAEECGADVVLLEALKYGFVGWSIRKKEGVPVG